MSESAIDQAKKRWSLPDTHRVVFPGGQSGSEFDRARKLASVLMPALIGKNRMVHATSLRELENLLSPLGITYHSAKRYGPSPGQMVFYRSGRLFVRVKTFGESSGPRAMTPHLSVFLVNSSNVKESDLIGYENEYVKFNPNGLARQKAPRRPEQDSHSKPKLASIGIDVEAWAGETHFNFPVTGCLE